MKPAVEEYFSSVPRTMLTLFMSITGGVSWEDVIHPLLSMSVVWVLFFLFYAAWLSDPAGCLGACPSLCLLPCLRADGLVSTVEWWPT